MWQGRGLDPITMEVIKNYLQAIVDEMAFTLERTCASQLIRDAQDFSIGLCDEHGDLLAVSLTAPGELGVIPAVMRHVLAAFGSTVAPGDIFTVNDPYHGGSHLNDIHVMKPVFHDGVLLGYVTSKAHHSDVGGRVRGSMAFDNTEIFQEGLRIPPLKLYDRGRRNETLAKMLELNTRFPDVLFADLHAQITALATGEAGLIELAEIYGAQDVKAYLAGLITYGEEVAREQVAGWPDGEAAFVDYCDDDGVSGKPIKIAVSVVKRGEELFFDFAGTSDQVQAGVNFPPYEAVSDVFVVVRSCLQGNLPSNSGLFRRVHVTVPEGTVINPRPPGPCSERGLVRYRAGDAVAGVLAPFAPAGVTAAGEGGTYLMRIGGLTQRGDPFLCVDLVMGTWGARHTKDGIDGISNPRANHTNTPIETIEANFPVRVESHTLVADTGGAGKYRGGLAIERSWRYLGNGEGFFRSRSDRRAFPPYGLSGGGTGSPSQLFLERPGEPPVLLPTKAVITIQPGDLIRLTLAGGGGWGDPLERDPALVAGDVRDGKVTPQHAERAYGVAIDSATLQVDAPATERLRAALRAAPHPV